MRWLARIANFVFLLPVACLTPQELRPFPDRYLVNVEVEAAKRLLGPGQPFRSDEIHRSASSSLHLVQFRGSMKAHFHKRHEETAFLVRGKGVMDIAGERTAIGPGTLMRIPAGFVHSFQAEGEELCLVLVSFSPPFDGEDRVFVEITPGVISSP